MPQRIPRYKLLLEAILTHTPDRPNTMVRSLPRAPRINIMLIKYIKSPWVILYELVC